MTSPKPDSQLVGEYAASGSEDAFHALVERHAGMVYATALRQVGESGLAEEITQNTFLALARKARLLRRHQTLAGWLHRTALLESKSRVRSELRRRRREKMAAALNATRHEGQSTSQHLVPLLDEALLKLRDHERQALILRFLEGGSLRDVGEALGVGEDTARKRVSRALDRVEEYFRRQGFAVPATTVSGLLSAQQAAALPAGLLAGTTQAAVTLSSGSTAVSLAGIPGWGLGHATTALVTLIVAAIPIIWQWQVQADIQEEQQDLATRMDQDSRLLGDLEQQLEAQQNALLAVESDRVNAQRQLEAHQTQLSNQAPRPVYSWQDNAPLARVPKELLTRITLKSVRDRQGTVDDVMAVALQLTPEERRRTQGMVDAFRDQYHAALAQRMEQVEPTDAELRGRSPDQVRAFALSLEPEVLDGLRQELFGDLEGLLGAERSQLFRNGLGDWMALDDNPRGMNTGMAIVSEDHRFTFIEPEPGSGRIIWTMNVGDHSKIRNNSNLERLEAWLPDHLRQPIQDWIDLALQPVPEEAP